MRTSIGLVALLLLVPSVTAARGNCVLLAGQSNAGVDHAEALRERLPCVLHTFQDGSSIEMWAEGSPNYEALLETVGSTPVRAVIWVQGEADGLRPQDAPFYHDRLVELIERFRRDLDAPTVVTLLPTRFQIFGAWCCFSRVRRAQLDVIETHPDACMGADPDALFANFTDAVHYTDETLARMARVEARATRRCTRAEAAGGTR